MKSFALRGVSRSAVVLLLSILLGPAARHAGGAAAAMPPGDAVTRQPASEGGIAAWTRTHDPVVVSGSQFPAFGGVPLGDLFVYAFRDGAWAQIPFQLDEVNSAGEFVPTEDGALDSNDQLVFMASDVGATAAAYEWIGDPDSRGYTRYEVQVTNPLNTAEKGWVYVYRSATLSPTFAPYVVWDGANNRFVGTSYVAGYAPSSHSGMDSLQLNGTGVDILDREKIRVSGQCQKFGQWWAFTATEDDATGISVTPDIQGPVRLGGGTLTSQAWSYASLREARVEFDASYVYPQCDAMTFDSFRFSSDWRNPADSGMAPMTYYDSNNAGGVAVDGSPDSIPTEPVATWQQVCGARGSIVQVASVTPGGGTASNYYKDDQTYDSGDTGDKRSFADMGFRLSNPTSLVVLGLSDYILAASQPNVGGTYKQYHDNPLQAAATAQTYVEPAVADFAGSPLIGPAPLLVTFTNLSTGGYSTCAWTFGDGGTSSSCGDPTHSYVSTGFYSVALTVSGPGGTDTLTRTDYVGVYDPPVAGFSGTPTNGAPPLLVSFANLSSGIYTTCLWSFGDGETSDNCADPAHTYAGEGTFSVTLTVTGPGGTDILTRPDYIAVYEGIHASFTGEPTEGGAPLAVSFTNNSTGAYDTCAWTFGDGDTSAECANPTHGYTTVGTYTVSLTVTGIEGTHTLTRTNYIAVYEPPHAEFAGDPTSGLFPLTVSFADLSSGAYDTCSWAFGDGGTSNDCNNPAHTYTRGGLFSVTLTVSGPGGTDTQTKADYIEVLAYKTTVPFCLRSSTGQVP